MAAEIAPATYHQLIGRLNPNARGLFQAKMWFVDPATGNVEIPEMRAKRLQILDERVQLVAGPAPRDEPRGRDI
jgi:hypothetical protein